MSATENAASGSMKPEDVGICEHCVTGERMSGTPKGVLINTSPLPTYVARATTGATNAKSGSKFTPGSTKALVIIPDVFGFSIPNPKLTADILAEKCGIDVWAVDIFNGDPPLLEDQLAPYLPDEPGQKLEVSFFMTLKKYYLMVTAIPKLVTKFRPGIQDASTKDTIAYLRNEYKYEKIALVGYCWGGGITARLAAIPGVADSVISVHPGGRYKDAVPRAVVPVAYLVAEQDDGWDPKVGADTQAAWEARADAPKHLFKTYPGTTHGFGARPKLSLPKVKAAWDELNDDIASWVEETL